MEATAQVRHLRVTAQKARRVVDLARGGVAADVVASLRFQPQAVAEPIRKVIESAMANARVKADEVGERLDDSDLMIKEIFVDEGPTMKRIRPRAQGRAARILKRSCHITVVVATQDAVLQEGAR